MNKFVLDLLISPDEEGVKYPVFKLIINGYCSYDELCNYCENNNLVAELNSLNIRIAQISQGFRLPKEKFRQLKREKTDKIPDYEVKTKHLRVYIFKDSNNNIVAHWSTKKTQNKELNKFRNIKKSYFS